MNVLSSKKIVDGVKLKDDMILKTRGFISKEGGVDKRIEIEGFKDSKKYKTFGYF